MFIEFGDKYGLNCFIDDGEPCIKLEGEYYTINYSSSRNEERTYLNQGFLAFKFLDFNSNVVLMNYSKIASVDGKEVLISFKDNYEKEICIYFDLVNNKIGYDVF